MWDLWFRPGARVADGEQPEAGKEPVRFGRLLGDLADRKKTDVVPRVRLGETGTGVWFYFSLVNDLVLALQPTPAEQPAAAPAKDAGKAAPAKPAQGAPSSPGS